MFTINDLSRLWLSLFWGISWCLVRRFGKEGPLDFPPVAVPAFCFRAWACSWVAAGQRGGLGLVASAAAPLRSGISSWAQLLNQAPSMGLWGGSSKLPALSQGSVEVLSWSHIPRLEDVGPRAPHASVWEVLHNLVEVHAESEEKLVALLMS